MIRLVVAKSHTANSDDEKRLTARRAISLPPWKGGNPRPNTAPMSPST